MKNLIKKHLALPLIIFICTTVFANSNYTLSVTPHTGVTFTQVDEILYDSNGKQCSLLEWEQNPVIDAGISFDLLKNRFLISTDFELSFLAGDSKMTDTDWNNGEKYSVTVHPLNATKNIDTSVKFAYQFNSAQKKWLTVQPELQLEYQYIDFDAGNGKGVRNDRNIKVYGVNLTRHSFFVFTGLKGIAEIGNRFNIAAEFLLAPYTYQYEKDFHKGVKNPFTSIELQNGYFSKFKAGLTAGIKLNEKLALNIFSQVLFGTKDKGDFYSNYYTEKITKFEDQQSGTNIFAFKCGVSTSYLIF